MIFSSSQIEKAGNDAYLNGVERNKNPYIGKGGYINKLKVNIWFYGWDKAENDCRSA